MSLTDVPASERAHIAFFGRRNAGKSSLVNAVTGQSISIVSDILGTTTDPVHKTMEILPLGPVVIVDTPGFDDEGLLGELRIEKTAQILQHTDIAVLAIDASAGISDVDKDFLSKLQELKIPYVIAYTKADLHDISIHSSNEIKTSTCTNEGIDALKERLAHMMSECRTEKYILSDLFDSGDVVVLVTPIDHSAPKGRLILPQQQTLREILDFHGIVVTCQTDELSKTLSLLSVQPRLVVTDSQDFEAVGAIVPQEIPITSFSLLFARYRGTLSNLISQVNCIDQIHDGDRILISEGCTHHRQCEDIGTKKIPAWIEQYTGVHPVYTFSSGGDFPNNLSDYALIVHCGGCMLNEKEMKRRIDCAHAASVPIVNYGALIAKTHGLFDRAIKLFT